MILIIIIRIIMILINVVGSERMKKIMFVLR